MKKFVCIILSVGILVSLFGCKEKEASDTASITTTPRDSSYFSSQVLTLEVPEDVDYSVMDATTDGTNIALLLKYKDPETAATLSTSIYLTDMKGAFIANIAPDGYSITRCDFISTSLLSVFATDMQGQFVQLLVDRNTNEIASTKVVCTDTASYFWDYMYYDNQWYFLCDAEIAVYSDSFEKIGTIPLGDAEANSNAFYIQDDTLCIGLPIATGTGLFTIDTDKFALIENGNAYDYATNMESFTSGYLLDYSDGIFKIHADKKSREEILDWNQVDIPPSQYAYNLQSTFILSEDYVLVASAAVLSGSDDLVLLTHQDTNPNANKQTLVIGGYGVSGDSTIKYAVYEFNTTNADYRIELEDFWTKYPYTDAASILTAQTEMLTDFAAGDSPDIFYGKDFNYETWGKSGMVIDLSEYIESDFDASLYLDNIMDLAYSGDSCYSIFPSFTVKGFVTRPDVVGNDPSVTIDEVMQISESFDGQTITNAYKTGLVNSSLQFSISSFYDYDQKEFDISEEDFQTILEYADAFGGADSDLEVMNNDANALFTHNELCFEEANICCAYDYKEYSQRSDSGIMYVGYPSIRDSARVCIPNSMVAISSGTEDADACWDFIKGMFSDYVQTSISETVNIPVLKSALDNQINKAMDSEIRNDADKVLASLFSADWMTSEAAQGFRDTIDSLNCLYSYDGYLGVILQEESNSYFTSDKPIKDVIASMESRINLYLEEQWYGGS